MHFTKSAGISPEIFSGVTNDKAFLRRKLLLTIDAHSDGVKKMKTPRLILALLALTFALASQSPPTALAQPYPKKYSARLISPRAGEVLVPGQVVRIQWTADFPGVDLTMCETELLLSLDGGRTIYMMLTEQRNPKVQYFDWTVPNTPTNEAVLDIRFGCLNLYPETSSLQVQSAFVISSPSVN
jgi:hypothetical protein